MMQASYVINTSGHWKNKQMIILYETDPKTLSKLTNEEVQEQLQIHEKLYGEFENWIYTKQNHNENIDKDIMLLFLNRKHNYWDLKAEYERRISK